MNTYLNEHIYTYMGAFIHKNFVGGNAFYESLQHFALLLSENLYNTE